MLPKSRAALFALVLSLCACTVTVDSGGSSSDDVSRDSMAARIDPLVEESMDRYRVPGIAVGILQDGDVLLAKGYGLADVENDVPVTEHTVFRIGSVTKQFTAAAIMLLAEDGKLELQADLTEYLPEYPSGGRSITVENLLNHTSGIKGYTEMQSFGQHMREDLEHDAMIAMFSAEPFEFEPGARYQYNNSAYYLLGVIIERVTGGSYTDFVSERIFAPLGMDDSHYLRNDPIVPRRAEGYGLRNGELVNDSYLSMELPYAAGSLGSSVADLLTWQEALFGGRVVSDASLTTMSAAGVLNDGTTTTYGYGLSLMRMSGHDKIGHGGGINGFLSQLSRYPDDDGLTIAVLANSTSAHPGALESRIARELLGVPEPVIEEIELGAEELELYVGTYHPGRSPIPVRSVQGELRMFGTRLRPVGDHRFVADTDPTSWVTFTVRDGRSVAMETERQGRRSTAPRIE